ncbi:hypothetical protein G9A89_012188 [Geosiphon pyriformis]|nr:hypothetical protein G9A89_012188 [Geosiphon pyriformis]
MPEEQDFHYTAPSEGRATAQQQNSSYTSITISPARIAENANFSDIFPFEFKANESPFLLSNTAANKQKAITAMYTEAETPVGEIDNFPFTLDRITIPVKVLIMNAPQYQALTEKPKNYNSSIKNNIPEYPLLVKAPAFEFEPKEKKPIIETFMALGLTSNWADETEQQYFSTNDSLETKEPVTTRWNVPYSKPEPQKQRSYISLKYKDCHKILSSMGACISPEEEYENHTCYYCKAYILLEECNWIDVAMRGGVCNQTCQYALLISEKVKRGTLFNEAYNSAFNKLYHYLHDAKMIFNLAMALINGATKKDVHQMKEAEYIKYTMELAGFDYEDEQMNIRLYEECIMSCDEQWCSECYAFSIPLSSESDENEIEFGEPKAMEEIETTSIYFIEN